MWFPTLWGGFVLLVLAAVTSVALALAANGFLAPNEPARDKLGRGASTLVVEGWMTESELAQAVVAFQRGGYERVLTTGGPIPQWSSADEDKTFALRAADYLRTHGLASVPVVAVPAPASQQDRTFLSAVMVREWARRSGVKFEAIDLVSAGVHARRSRLLYRMALGADVEIGVLAAQPADFDAQRWWSSSSGIKSTLGEALSLIWTKCCFWPGPPGSHEERWAVPRA